MSRISDIEAKIDLCSGAVGNGAADAAPITCSEPEYDHFARLAATICETPFGAVTLMIGGKQWLKGNAGLPVEPVPMEQTFCIHAIRGNAFLEVRDAANDDRFRFNPMVTGPQHVRFYAGVPLRGEQGDPLGALCVVDTRPRPDGLSMEQQRALLLLADQASLQMKLRRALAERDGTARDLREAVSQLRWSSTHDLLTGLANRLLLRQALAGVANHPDRPVALLAIDVDHFKRINDSFGHQTGDALLKEIARRLAASMRCDDLAARTGGDEFAILVHDLLDEADLMAFAERLLEVMRAPFHYEDRALECRITIGGALLPPHAADVNELVRFADAALYEAKSCGRGRFAMFTPELLHRQSRRLRELARARTALERGHVVPFYQPKVDLADGRILGLEALLRVVEPGQPPAFPSAIAAAFDEAELAQEIGSCLMAQVLDDVSRWTAAGIRFGRVAVNVSSTEIGDPTYAARLLAALERHGVPAEKLEIEIIESVLLDQRSSTVLASVQTLSDAGVRIAFDDFGTGYAALAHLPNFPIDTIKIDQSFVRDLASRGNQAIVRALTSLAGELGLEAVAEGVETTQQAAQLLGLGCYRGQGFLYGKAVCADTIADILRTRGGASSRASGFTVADRSRQQRRAA